MVSRPGSIHRSTAGEICVVRGGRRRIVVRHGASGLEQVVYVIETKGSKPPNLLEAPFDARWRVRVLELAA